MSAPPFPCEPDEDNDVCWPCEILCDALQNPAAIDFTRTLPHRVAYHELDHAFWREPGRLVAPPPGRTDFEQEAPF